MKTEIVKIIDAELKSHLCSKETDEEFIDRVCRIYLTLVYGQKGFATSEFFPEVLEEVEFEATEVFRIKIYGHFNLASYRLSLLERKVV
ncbi:MAG: hypothetical protein WA160_06230 [Pseudobdellovibrio sp.]